VGRYPSTVFPGRPGVLIQTFKSVLLVISALFPIVDPIGGSPVFLSLTINYDRETRKLLARRIAMNSLLLMVGSFTIGSHVLSFFGISLPVVQVGGGMIVIATGWAMLNQPIGANRKTLERSVNCTDALRDAFYPLTMPLTVGPGSISVAITLGANTPHNLGAGLLSILTAVIGSTLVAVSIYFCYAFADRLVGVVGPSGTNVIIKLTSFLLVCIGVQIAWNGVSQLLRSLMHA
jgi:multiple antibiotic resistance protein